MHHRQDYSDFYHQQMIQAATMCRIPEPHPPLAAVYPPIIHPERISCEVSLLNADLWKQFHEIGTEMIITKGGRRMFPSLRASMSGLDPRERYCVLLEMSLQSRRRLRWANGAWIPAGGAEPQSARRLALHPDSPATGEHWNNNVISFGKVKLTNNAMDTQGHMILTSMHKYIPRIIIVKEADLPSISWSPTVTSFTFPETEFVAVTAYQSESITKLKIENNPFAKGFRESGQSRCKRKKHGEAKDESIQAEIREGDDEPPCKRFNSGSESTSGDDGSSAGSASPGLPSPSASPTETWSTLNPYARIQDYIINHRIPIYREFIPHYYGGYAAGWTGRFLPLGPPSAQIMAPPTTHWHLEDTALNQPIDLAVRNVDTAAPLRISTKSQKFTIRALIEDS